MPCENQIYLDSLFISTSIYAYFSKYISEIWKYFWFICKGYIHLNNIQCLYIYEIL